MEVGSGQVSLSTARHLSYRGKVLLNPELADLASVVSRLASGIPCLGLQTAGIPGVLLYLPGLYVGARGLNPRPHA